MEVPSSSTAAAKVLVASSSRTDWYASVTALTLASATSGSPAMNPTVNTSDPGLDPTVSRRANSVRSIGSARATTAGEPITSWAMVCDRRTATWFST